MYLQLMSKMDSKQFWSLKKRYWDLQIPQNPSETWYGPLALTKPGVGITCRKKSFKPHVTSNRTFRWQSNNIFPRLAGCWFRPSKAAGAYARLNFRTCLVRVKTLFLNPPCSLKMNENGKTQTPNIKNLVCENISLSNQICYHFVPL